MPRLDPATRNIVIGRLQAGESQNEVARTLNVNPSTIPRLWNWFNEWPPKEWKTLHKLLMGKIGTSGSFIYGIEPLLHQQLQPEYLDYEESAHKQSATGFDSMALDPEGRISERYRIDAVTQTWKSPLVQQIKGLDLPILAKNLVQRRVSFSAAETRWQNTCI